MSNGTQITFKATKRISYILVMEKEEKREKVGDDSFNYE